MEKKVSEKTGTGEADMYLDTSVAAKLYFNEPDSPRVSGILAGTRPALCSSELLISELRSAACRKLREKLVTRAQFKEAINTFMAHDKTGSWHLYPATRSVLCLSAELTEKLSGVCGLRTLDAVHLATCVEYALSPLFTTDKVMLAAAKALKIEILA